MITKSNNFIRFYTDHRISPVSQNIEDFEFHCKRRIALYRTLGIAQSFFENKDVLEVGPGSGYNSIVTASFRPRRYDLVEPNNTGFQNMVSLFKRYQVKRLGIHFYSLPLEDMKKSEYDIVLCEGLLPGLDNQYEFCKELMSRVKSGGVLIVTCTDAISVFFETLRRYLARYFVSKVNKGRQHNIDFDEIADLLAEMFNSHLATLKGMSRPVKDWVIDNMLNPASASLAASNEFSIQRCLTIFGNDFYFFSSSPSFLNDWTWYKNLPYTTKQFNKLFLASYARERCNLLHYDELVNTPSLVFTERVYKLMKKFSFRIERMDPLSPPLFERMGVNPMILSLREIVGLLEKLGFQKSVSAINEFLELFTRGRVPTVKEVSNMRFFSSSFGRGQQYISLIKK